MNPEIIAWSPGVTLDSIERQVIFKAFAFYRENKTATAGALGISIRTLDNKFEKYREEDKGNEQSERDRKFRADDFLSRSRGIVPVNGGGDSPSPQAFRQNGAKTSERVFVEPIANAPAEQPMSVQKRAEVQEVLPRQAAKGNHRSTR